MQDHRCNSCSMRMLVKFTDRWKHYSLFELWLILLYLFQFSTSACRWKVDSKICMMLVICIVNYCLMKVKENFMASVIVVPSACEYYPFLLEIFWDAIETLTVLHEMWLPGILCSSMFWDFIISVLLINYCSKYQPWDISRKCSIDENGFFLLWVCLWWLRVRAW